ncbi:MAG: MFS transporter [Promethearchaeota archaeon]
MDSSGNNILDEKLSSKRIFGYVIGTIPLVMIMGFFNLAYVNFFYDDLQLNETFWIIGLIIYAIVNAINDPLVGHISDNTNVARWGSRRIVYIKYFSPILSIIFVLIWFPWSIENQFIMFLQFVILVCAYDTVLNIVVMTWMALLPEMTMDIDERTKIGFLSGIVGFFAAIPTMIVPYIMNNHVLLQIGSIIVAIISLICYRLVVKYSKERPEFQEDKSPPLWESIKQTLKSRSFICFMGYNFFNILILSIGLSYLFIYSLILGEGGILYFFLISIFIGYGSNILCMKLREKYGIKKIMVLFITLNIIVGLISFFMVLNPATEWFLWIGVILGSFLGGAKVFGSVLQTFPIDEDELKYGARREGMFYGVNALFTMHAYSLGPIIATLILSASNYVKNGPLEVQPVSAIIAIKFIFFLLPRIFGLFGLIFLLLYPIKKFEEKEFQIDLAKFHSEKKQKLLVRVVHESN